MIGVLKKIKMEKYIQCLGEVDHIIGKIKKELANPLKEKKLEKQINFKNEVQKHFEYFKLLKQICIKERIIQFMIVD